MGVGAHNEQSRLRDAEFWWHDVQNALVGVVESKMTNAMQARIRIGKFQHAANGRIVTRGGTEVTLMGWCVVVTKGKYLTWASHRLAVHLHSVECVTNTFVDVAAVYVK